jgi:hypothetical protein
MQPRLEGRWLCAIDDRAGEVHCQQLIFFYQGKTDSRSDQEMVGAGNPRADVAETFDQFLL